MSMLLNIANKNRVEIDIDFLKYLQRLYNNNITVGACVNILSHYLLPERQIALRRARDDSGIELSDTEADHWDVFASEVFQQVLCFGFVIFTDTPHERCLSPSFFDRIDFDTSTMEIHASRMFSEDTTPVHVINAFNATPLSDGTVTSVMSRIAPEVEFMKSLHRHALTIETQKIHPDVYCETTVAQEKQTLVKRSAASEAMLVHRDGVTTRRTRQNPATEQRTHLFGGPTKRAKEIMNEQQLLLDNMQIQVEDDDAMKELYRADKTNLQINRPVQSLHALPPDLRIQKVFSTTARGDLVQLTRMNEQKICAVLGVPRSMLINDSVARADTQATHDCFRVSLKRYRKHVSHALSIAASITFGESVSVFLPDSYHGPPEELLKLYILGVISYETYANTIRSMYNLTEMQDALVVPLTDEQRGELVITCMQSMVTQHHGRT